MDPQEVDRHMSQALLEAKSAFHEDEVPVGCLIVSPHGETLARTYNTKEQTNDACAHAEVLAIQKAGQKVGWRLLDCSLIVTLEPCPMCLSAMLQARIGALYFGAYDRKGGALSLGYNFAADKRLNHTFSIMGGVRHYECSSLLSTYFKQKRNKPAFT